MNKRIDITHVIGAVCELFNTVRDEAEVNDPIVAITLDSQAFDRILASCQHKPEGMHRNRFELAGVTIRKAAPHGRGAHSQPEIKRGAK